MPLCLATAWCTQACSCPLRPPPMLPPCRRLRSTWWRGWMPCTGPPPTSCTGWRCSCRRCAPHSLHYHAAPSVIIYTCIMPVAHSAGVRDKRGAPCSHVAAGLQGRGPCAACLSAALSECLGFPYGPCMAARVFEMRLLGCTCQSANHLKPLQPLLQSWLPLCIHTLSHTTLTIPLAPSPSPSPGPAPSALGCGRRQPPRPARSRGAAAALRAARAPA